MQKAYIVLLLSLKGVLNFVEPGLERKKDLENMPQKYKGKRVLGSVFFFLKKD